MGVCPRWWRVLSRGISRDTVTVTVTVSVSKKTLVMFIMLVLASSHVSLPKELNSFLFLFSAMPKQNVAAKQSELCFSATRECAREKEVSVYIINLFNSSTSIADRQDTC
uniref:Uncharacterized protein n=2 Tax=Rhizophora mucronata TaxID=61149 RepID=A0A2P2JBQ4_RHIMU